MPVLDSVTPMMKQYQELKKKVPGAILLFRLGDFYEEFYEDAKIASSVLGITLTARDGGKTGKYPMCGFPYHAASNYIPKLVKAGYKVAICEQVEDPKKAKGIVKRDIVSVITPGTAIDENLISEKNSNYLACINKIGSVYGLALVELSTGDFRVTEIFNEHDLFSEVFRVYPSEFIIPEMLFLDEKFKKKLSQTSHAVINHYDDWIFELSSCEDKLTDFLGTVTLEGFGINAQTPVIGAAGAALHFLQENLCATLDNIKSITFYSLSDYMIIDPISQRNLELIEPSRTHSQSKTLYDILDFTSTSMGARLLKSWITSPLMDCSEIILRQDAIAELLDNQQAFYLIEEHLGRIRDIERLISRCGLRTVSPRDVLALKYSLQQVPHLKKVVQGLSGQFFSDIDAGFYVLDTLVEEIERAIVDNPPVSSKDGGVIKGGYHEPLDEIRHISVHGKEWMAQLQRKEIERTGIKSLKVKYNKVFGYHLEVTRSYLDLVPDDYIRKQTLASAERFVTSELKEMESKILNAEDQIQAIEAELFALIQQKIVSYTQEIQETGRKCALLDCIVSLAKAAVRYNYSRPQITEDDRIEIKDGRHPVIEALLEQGEFVPNDLIIDTESNQLLIITGPNMAGKSTYIRQAALLVVMAQIGSFIPAKYAVIGIVDRIFTRVGASDELGKGQSTFMVEMIETANILNNATPHSLIVLDEIGRGTSTFDGISIAWAVAEYLSTESAVRARTLFATHYHELTELENQIEGIVNYNIAVKEWNDQIIFLRKIVSGGTDKSYGIHVARLAGLPKRVVNRALEILSELENDCIREHSVIAPFEREKKTTVGSEQLTLFGVQQYDPIKERLKKLSCDTLTPLEALNILYELKGMAAEDE
ncbi:DNA mismatch repair protein MutS [bacterium]|nr:DNA mismatch repair protein MutS [bacterium]MCP5462312.1 DNA mismatch repair protein MutS [bacterium]